MRKIKILMSNKVRQNNLENNKFAPYIMFGIVLGILLGLMLGILIYPENLAIGISIGIPTGMGIGVSGFMLKDKLKK